MSDVEISELEELLDKYHRSKQAYQDATTDPFKLGRAEEMGLVIQDLEELINE